MSDPKPSDEYQGETNAFGGANPHGLYVPLTDTEQEVLARLLEADDLEMVIHGWGILHQPRIIVGDARIAIQFNLAFNAPALPQPLHFLDLELRTRAGLPLFKQRMATMHAGKPIEVCAGVSLGFQWDIMLHHIDPAVVKAIKPGAVGLTSRRLDKETGEATFSGNMRLDNYQKKALHQLEQGQAAVRRNDLHRVIKATKDSGDGVKVTNKGIVAPKVR